MPCYGDTTRNAKRYPASITAYQRLLSRQPSTANDRFTGNAAHLEHLRNDPGLGYLLVAEHNEQLAGFAILYRSFDTRTLKPVLIINDVYVAPKFRRRGLARQLMAAAFELAADEGFASANWQTRTSNLRAQHLYDQIGERETGWLHYHHVIHDA
ncbi:acetyltransferase [Lacticaseibacillus casei DSM 20011 = JCM 1134 = ATCC 393]|uniref:Acetyltransferase n=1 Tax=Lacticaseibacillus casei DSM 20011 = JCM 1134 = ATCC 393 TaxID=1423732 RepID=A0AAD1APC1_LACCA|nr:acetyltransferase [Lacticaseibacillus casei DSM 20011 = JCM 1134 = ATCC 393]